MMTKQTHAEAFAQPEAPAQNDAARNEPTLVDAKELVLANMAQRNQATPTTLQHFLQSQAEQEQADAQDAPTLAEMAGLDGAPIERIHDTSLRLIAFFPRSPRISALDTITENMANLQAEGAKRGAAVIQTAQTFLYVEAADGTRRQATPDEVDGCFNVGDVPMLTRMIGKYLNIKTQTGDASRPNA